MANSKGKQSISIRFQLFSPGLEDVITAETWENLLIESERCAIHPASETDDPSRPKLPLWWVDVRDAKKQDVADLTEALAIHPLTAEDVVVREPREKVEVFKNYYLISLQTLLAPPSKQNEKSSSPSSAPFYILVFARGLVTFSPSRCNHVDQVLRRIRKTPDPAVLSSDWLCYALIDDIIDSFEPSTRAIQSETEAIEDQVFIARLDDVRLLIPRIDILRKNITRISRCLNGKTDVLNALVKRCGCTARGLLLPVFPDGEYMLYLGDVQDHLVTMLATLEHLDGVVGRSQANCLAQLSATNLRVSLTITSVMSKVTLFATILVPCHLLTGLFGMNVVVPGQDEEGTAWFWGIVGFIVVFSAVCCAVAARFKLWHD